MNLLSVGQDDLSTSDDEEKVIKPVVPPRNRGEIAVKRHQSIKDKPKVNNRNISNPSEELDRTLTNNDLQDYDHLDVSTVQRKYCRQKQRDWQLPVWLKWRHRKHMLCRHHDYNFV